MAIDLCRVRGGLGCWRVPLDLEYQRPAWQSRPVDLAIQQQPSPPRRLAPSAAEVVIQPWVELLRHALPRPAGAELRARFLSVEVQ